MMLELDRHRAVYLDSFWIWQLSLVSRTQPCQNETRRARFCWLHTVTLYNNQINAYALTGQSAVDHCAGKPMEKSHVFWIIILKE